jgi:hypothetical protein
MLIKKKRNIFWLEQQSYVGSYGVVETILFFITVDVVSSDTCDEDREKHDDARSISIMSTMSLD